MDFKPKPVHMFNSYTKLTTVFSAFALLFSISAFAQNTPGDCQGYASPEGVYGNQDMSALVLNTELTISTCSWSGEIFQLNNCVEGNEYLLSTCGQGTWDSFLEVRDGDGLCISANDDGTSGGCDYIYAAQVHFVPPASGTYFLAINEYGGGAVQTCRSINAMLIGEATVVDVLGCTDSTADNYNPAANVDDGSCIACSNVVVMFNMYDSALDGWNDGVNPVGGLDFDGSFYAFGSDGSLSIGVCIPAGCYGGAFYFDYWGSEISWDITADGVQVASGGPYTNGLGGTYFSFYTDINEPCVVWGCTDDTACNYDIAATFDDSSCEYSSCAGCMDPTACNYDSAATFDVGCDYTCIGCTDSTATNYDAAATIACADCCIYCPSPLVTINLYDSWGDGWNANTLTIDGVSYCFPDVNGDCTTTNVYTNWANVYSYSVCLDLSVCHDVTYNNTGTYQNENSWDIVDSDGTTILASSPLAGCADDASCSGVVGGCTYGCSDAGACNYVGPVDLDDDSCDYDCIGCMDSSAANYDSGATIDSGLCVFCDPGTFVLTINMSDASGDGWEGAQYYIYNTVSGALELQGDLDNAFSGDGLSYGSDLICLAPGCYNFEVNSGVTPSDILVNLSDQLGTDYGSTGAPSSYPVDFLLTGQCAFEGCTSSTALNFNISASIDDGSCLEPPANDQLDNAEALFCGAIVSGSLLYSNDDQNLTGQMVGNDAVNTAGVWYVFNAAADQQVTASTCNTPSNVDATTDYTTDTKLHVFTNTGSLVGVASNDDGCGTGNYLSSVTFNAFTGIDYYIYVSEYSPYTSGNDFVIDLECNDCASFPTNDDCDTALPIVDGQVFTSSLCCTAPESMEVPDAGFGSAYGVWYSTNSADFDALHLNLLNVSNENIGLSMFTGADCSSLVYTSIGGLVTGQLAGPVPVVPNSNYYFVVFTTNLEACGDFDFTVTGVIYGCTDSMATNFDANATDDDGTCEYVGVVPGNDLCSGAVVLECNTVTTGSTGGATITGSPLGVSGCETSPGAGVWYSFVGDGQVHDLSTCFSDIDSKINLYTATEDCGGGGIDVPPADPCGAGLVTVHYALTPDFYPNEMGFSITEVATGTVWVSAAYLEVTAAGLSGSVCLPEGDYTVTLMDSWGDGWVWNGTGSLSLSNDLGESIGYWSMADPGGASGAGLIETVSLTVTPYSMDPSYIPGTFECVAAASGSDNLGTCDFFNADDVSIVFVSEVGTLYYALVGSEGTAGAFDLSFTCATVVEGCTNVAACNYDPTANVDNDTCDFWSCVCATETGVPVQLNMEDSYGDGWNGNVYTIYDVAGAVVYTGDIDNAQFTVNQNNQAGAQGGYDFLCLEPGCYSIAVDGGGPYSYQYEISWNMLLEGETLEFASGGSPEPVSFSIGGAVCGCTDSGACNYDGTATADDGSCEFDSCAGCTDPTSCSYDPVNPATVSLAGACCYSNCVSIEMTDSWGDGWIGSYTLSTVDGTVIGTGTLDGAYGTPEGEFGIDTYCLADGCYTIDVVCDETTYCTEMSWYIVGAFGGGVSGFADESATFNVGNGDMCIVGCDISCACNYDSAVNISDVTDCVFSGCEGCTYLDAINYDPAALADDGLCEFEIANPCPADLNGDGSVTALDLLAFLAAFGTVC